MNEKYLHIVSYKNAFKYKIMNFYTTKKCRDCGSHERAMQTPSQSSCHCAYCYPIEGSDITYQSVYLREKSLNEKKAKLRKDNWCIPVVYGGYNTVR